MQTTEVKYSGPSIFWGLVPGHCRYQKPQILHSLNKLHTTAQGWRCLSRKRLGSPCGGGRVAWGELLSWAPWRCGSLTCFRLSQMQLCQQCKRCMADPASQWKEVFSGSPVQFSVCLILWPMCQGNYNLSRICLDILDAWQKKKNQIFSIQIWLKPQVQMPWIQRAHCILKHYTY